MSRKNFLFRIFNTFMCALSFSFFVYNNFLFIPTVLNENHISYRNGDNFDFYLNNGSFCIEKNGVEFQKLNLSKNYRFVNNSDLSLNLVAIPIAVGVGALAVGAVTGTAGGIVTAGAAVPGAACVEATLGGASVVASEAAGASIGTAAAGVAVGAAVGLGIA